MTDFDTISKTHARAHPMDFVNHCLDFEEQDDVIFVKIITPEQPTIEMHQADMLIEVELNGERVLVHLEFQTTDSYDPEMSLRMAGYIIRTVETYRLPVYSGVIYLRPDAGRRDPGYYLQDRPNHRIFIEYQVLRLIEVEGAPILAAKPPGLIPFTPLMKPPEGVSSEEWLRRCVQTADSLDVPNKPAYLGSLAVLGNLIYDPETISNIILEETMNQPSILEYWAERAHQQGIQQGVRESTREYILAALEIRLQADATQTFKPALDAIDDLQRLKQLHRAAVLAENVEDFQRALEANGS